MTVRGRLVALTSIVALATVPVADESRASAPSAAALLARHVPILVLHLAERFRPVPVDGFLADSDLQRRTSTGWEKVDGPLPAGGADLRLDQRLCRAIEGIAASPCYAQAEDAHGAGPVVYGAAFRTKNRIDLQYWIWYPYDDYSPTVPAGEAWQVHEGDWEAVSVVTDRSGRPLAVGYSQHSKGVRRPWVTAPKRGQRPLVYVALGSHANYPAPGVHRLDPRIVTPLLITIFEQAGVKPIEHAGKGRVVRPRLVRVAAASPAWMAYSGRWGEDEYLHVPGGEPTPSPGGGPRGPAFHEQWQKPVSDVLSWPRG